MLKLNSLTLSLIIFPVLTSCADIEDESTTKNYGFTCPQLTMQGEPKFIEEGFMTNVSMTVSKNESIFNCNFMATAENNGQIDYLGFGMVDFMSQDQNLTTITFRLVKSRMPGKDQITLASYEGLQLKQVLWGKSTGTGTPPEDFNGEGAGTGTDQGNPQDNGGTPNNPESSGSNQLPPENGSSTGGHTVEASCSGNNLSYSVRSGATSMSGSVSSCRPTVTCNGSTLQVSANENGSSSSSSTSLASASICNEVKSQLESKIASF